MVLLTHILLHYQTKYVGTLSYSYTCEPAVHVCEDTETLLWSFIGFVGWHDRTDDSYKSNQYHHHVIKFTVLIFNNYRAIYGEGSGEKARQRPDWTALASFCSQAEKARSGLDICCMMSRTGDGADEHEYEKDVSVSNGRLFGVAIVPDRVYALRETLDQTCRTLHTPLICQH